MVYQFYHYDPSLAAAAAFASLFALTTIAHAVQLSRNSTWYMIPFLIGGIFEIIGYLGRVWSATQTPNWTMIPYLIQSLFLLLAPALFAASIYMTLGRIVRLTGGEQHTIIRVTWLTKIFVIGDVLSFFIQGGGGGILAKADGDVDQAKLGENLIKAGLVVQILFFGFFIIVAGLFHHRISTQPTQRSMMNLTVPWRKLLLVLYLTSVLILIRSVFRVVEYAQGSEGYLLAHEVFLYAFDAALMFLAMVSLNIFHPGRIVSAKILQAVARSEEDPEHYDMPQRAELANAKEN